MWRVVIDYGSRCEFFRVHSEWAANLICSEYKARAERRGDTTTKFYVVPWIDGVME